jgi:hypothetical protein
MRSKAWIARCNITMFREKLSAETDVRKRTVLADLLAEEQQKLVNLKVEES